MVVCVRGIIVRAAPTRVELAAFVAIRDASRSRDYGELPEKV